MRPKSPRIAVRAIIVHQERLLLVNAWPDGKSDLMCAPGGGVEPNSALPDNLKREVLEETGLTVEVGPPCLVNEFHDPESGFHQVDVYFRCHLQGHSETPDGWLDPEAIVTERKWVTRDEMADLRFKPDSLPEVAFADPSVLSISYDPLEELIR